MCIRDRHAIEYIFLTSPLGSCGNVFLYSVNSADSNEELSTTLSVNLSIWYYNTEVLINLYVVIPDIPASGVATNLHSPAAISALKETSLLGRDIIAYSS